MLNTKNRDDLQAIYEKEIANKLPIDTNLFEFEIILADHRYRWIVSGCVSISDLFPIYTYGSYQPSQERRNLFRINRHQLSTDYQFYLVWLITSHYVFLLDLLFSIAIGFRKQNLFFIEIGFLFFYSLSIVHKYKERLPDSWRNEEKEKYATSTKNG